MIRFYGALQIRNSSYTYIEGEITIPRDLATNAMKFYSRFVGNINQTLTSVYSSIVFNSNTSASVTNSHFANGYVGYLYGVQNT